jgi:proline dehydrogenase
MNFDNTEIAFASKSTSSLKQAHFLFSSMGNPWLTKLGIGFTQFAFKLKLPIKGIIKDTIFKQFCGGETLIEANQTANNISEYGISVIMDYGVEGKSNEDEFELTVNSFIETIKFTADKPNIPFISLKVTAFARFELLEKLHANIAISAQEHDEALRVQNRVERICECAYLHGKMILIDAEETWIQEPIDDLANAMMKKYNKERVYIYNTYQMYCHERFAYLKEQHQVAKSNGYKLGAKIVRGAYMEKERDRADKLNYKSPIQHDKDATDMDFNESVKYCLINSSEISLFIGTHNEVSCLMATLLMKENNLSNNSALVYFSQLYGMSDNISFNLAKEGYNVSKYLPYGPVEDVIPYLMRRAQENTSVAGQTGRELGLISKELERRKISI